MKPYFIPATIKLKYLPLNLEGKSKEEIAELRSLCEMINDSRVLADDDTEDEDA